MEFFTQTPLLFDQLLLTLPSSSFLISIVISALAFFIAAQFLEGVQIKSLMTAAFVATIVAILNAALVDYLAMKYDLNVGGKIAGFITNSVVILIASAVLSGFKVKGIKWAIILAVVVSLLNGFLVDLIGELLK